MSKMVFGRYALIGLCIVLTASTSAQTPKRPSFAEPIPNVTAAVGREAVLQCTIDNLDSYKVAWIKVDTETLLSYHTHVIPRDNRLKVTNSNSDRQWFLHIKNLDVSDRGFYMCQINTEPMISEKGYLDVTVPPSIVEEDTSTDITVDERSKVSMRCKAAGYPQPRVIWRREDGKEINLGPMGAQKSSVLRMEGEFLNMTQVTREDMGAYLCIASNGIPPSVSKRILLHVNFQPKIRVLNQMVGAALGSDVVLGCRLEASPRPLTSWIRNDGVILLNNQKYELTEEADSYRINMQLKIKNLEEKDFGHYKCVAKNTLGDKEGFVRLIEISPPTSIPHSTQSQEFYVPVHKGSSDVSKNDSPMKKGYGIPAPNSLRDESQSLSSEKQLSSSKDGNILDSDKPKRKQNQHPTQGSQTDSSGSCQISFSIHVQLAFLLAVLLFD
ncbi:lachesin-like isoform X2 [Argiope bruennichi]|uniref:lachesin-like isoform X2 n=1 Tax=Argiope bruennichi TaxID=94029 RepID=UPI0024952BF4|nr:lachesin-like isoform X2 [Argiope bruennichi]